MTPITYLVIGLGIFLAVWWAISRLEKRHPLDAAFDEAFGDMPNIPKKPKDTKLRVVSDNELRAVNRKRRPF